MNSFDLVLPKTLEQAIGALPRSGERGERERVKLLAGGQDLFGELQEHLLEPEALVDLKGVAGLDGFEPRDAGGLRLGALVTLARLATEPWVRTRLPVLAEAAASVASPQIRTVATLGGNLCQRPRCVYYRSEHARCLKKGGDACFAVSGHNAYNAILGGGPSYIVHPSDLAPALVALDARVTLVGPGGERELALEDFYVLPADGDPTRETVLGTGEVLTHVHVPPGRDGWRSTYVKVRAREAFDFALTAVALALRMNGPRVEEARFVLGGVAPKPWRSLSTEGLLVGRTIDDETCRLAGEDAVREAEPMEQNGYKVPMTKGAVTKALRALARA